MEAKRKLLNQQQNELRQALTAGESAATAWQLFFAQHARTHSARMAGLEVWSFEDWVLDDLSAAQMRQIPPGEEHSIAWMIWHIARIEDVVMNLLVAGSTQRLHQDGWLARLQVPFADTGNGMPPGEIALLSSTIDLAALRAYRQAIGQRTRQIVQVLSPHDLKRKVDPARLQQVRAEKAVRPEGEEVLEYWGGRTLAGLLLMPATRHNIVHLNEALKLKKKC